MADEIRDTAGPVTGPEAPRALSDALADFAAAPGGYELTAAARLLQAAHPDRPRIGRATRIEQDFVRFAQIPTLAFQPSEIGEFGPRDGTGPPRLGAFGFGVFGPDGALPLHVTEEAVQEPGALSEFVDVFHHRLVALLYRAWETTQVAVSRDRPGEDPYEGWIGALYGCAPVELRDRDALPDDLRRRLAGWFGSGPRSAAGLAAVAEEITGVPASVEEFRGEWLAIAPEQRARLGGPAMGLGADVVVGDRYFSLQSRLRIRTGRLTIDRYRALLPPGELFPRLRDGVRAFLGLAMGWEVRLTLDAGDVPPLRLGGDGPLRLGWETWLTDDSPRADADDLVLEGTYSGPG